MANAAAELSVVSEARAFEGVQGVYRHASAVCAAQMTFGLYLPPQAAAGPVPVLWFLAGLTCTHENAMVKAGAQGWAARHGLALVFPDTSPRGEGVADDPAFDLGQGAGFYVDATEAPWSAHFAMRRYVLEELPELLFAQFPLRRDAQGITGHSMGGHGALTLALSTPGRFRSLSALAPIAHPSVSSWGRPQLTAYLGPDAARWAEADAALLLRARGAPVDAILIDQGAADPFLDRLAPQELDAALAAAGLASRVRMRAGYDHSYFFVASVMEEHVRWHAERLAS